eukprot:6187078-Pleurochrysis_carterae.AAC.2
MISQFIEYGKRTIYKRLRYTKDRYGGAAIVHGAASLGQWCVWLGAMRMVRRRQAVSSGTVPGQPF